MALIKLEAGYTLRNNIEVGIFLSFLLLLSLKAEVSNATQESGSLSELNLNTEENILLKNLPWSKKDPFLHPDFEPKKYEPIAEEYKATEEITPPKLELNAILFNNESSSAVINGNVVKVGSVIKEQKVLEINKDNILLDFNGKAYRITIEDFTINGEKN